MGRTVYAEERLQSYLTSLSNSTGYVIGLILGQSTGQKDFVVHLAKSPPPPSKNVIEETLISSTAKIDPDVNEKYIKSIKDIPESWVADHANDVTRMLPGGMWVLGIFVVGPADIMNDNNNIQRFKLILHAIRTNLSWNKYLYGNNDGENLILSFNSLTRRHVCKSVNISNNGILKSAEWKFQTKPTKWHQLETTLYFDRVFFTVMDKDSETLKKQLQDILEYISDTINSAMVVIEGEVKLPDDSIETIDKRIRKKSKSDNDNSNNKVLEVDLYISCPTVSDTNIKVTPCSASIQLIGQIVSKVFVHQKANIEETAKALKQDIIRSMASRLELHWDSLIEEENGSPEENITLHEPPRRILIRLPENKVTLSNYLFPGEGPQEALVSLQELLDLKTEECNIEKEIEYQADPTEFYYQSDVIAVSAEQYKNSTEDHLSTIYTTGFSIAVLVIVAAILIHQLY